MPPPGDGMIQQEQSRHINDTTDGWASIKEIMSVADKSVEVIEAKPKGAGRPPKVSIGLPVYNGEAFIGEAIESILDQTFTDFELLISDNASTDRTPEICRRYADGDARVRYSCNEANLGAAANYNRVFHLARGDYFRWAAHDDKLAPDYLAACVAVLDRDPSVVLCYPQTLIIDERSEPLHVHPDNLDLASPEPHLRFDQYFRRYSPRRDECNAVFGLVRREVLAQTGLIGAYASSDMILLGEIALLGKIQEVQRPLFLRRDHVRTSVRANRDLRDRAAWFDPALKAKRLLPRWRWFGQYLDAVGRAPLSYGERLKCYAVIAKRFVPHNYRIMVLELGGSVKHAVLGPVRMARAVQSRRARPEAAQSAE